MDFVIFINYESALQGWGSPNIILLTSDETPLPSGKITMEQASWVLALNAFGNMIGNLFFGGITNVFGRKVPCIFTAFPMIVSTSSFD